MGEGVSLSLPRNGFPVVNPLVVFVPFSREHGFSGGFSLPVFQEEEGDSLKISLIESNNHVGLTTRGSLFQRRVHPFSLARKLQKWVWRRFHGGFSSRCSIAPKGGYPYASFCSRRSLRSVFLVGANCFGDRPIHIPGSLSPINGKSDDGCLFPSGFRGLGYASTDLLKKEVEHASFAAAGSGAPDVAGKISTVGIVSSRDLDRDLRGSRASDLRLDLLNCIKASPSMEVAGDTRLKAKSWILDPVFKSLLSPARGMQDLFSAGYLLSRGYGFGSLVWASSESDFWVAFLVNTNLVESTLWAMVIFGIICCWRSHGIETESLFWIDQGAGVVQFGRRCDGIPTSVVGFNSVGLRTEICSVSGAGIGFLGICEGDAEVIKHSGKALACAISSSVRSTDSGVKSLDLQGIDLR